MQVASCGCSIAKLEEVFLKVGEGCADDHSTKINVHERINQRAANRARTVAPIVTGSINDPSGEDVAPLLAPTAASSGSAHYTGVGLLMRQLKALLLKRALNTSRSKFTAAIQLVPPLFFTCIALILANTYFAVATAPTRGLSHLNETYGVNTLIINFAERKQHPLPPSQKQALATSYDAMRKGDQHVHFYNWSTSPTGYSPLNSFLARQASGVGMSHTNKTQATYMFNQAPSARRALVLLDYTTDDSGTGLLTTGWFNGQGIHTIAEALALIDSSLLAAYVGPSTSIDVSNHPLPRTNQEISSAQQKDQVGFNVAFSILFGMAPLASSFLIFLVGEKSSKAKHVQMVAGVGPVSYWLSGYLWDFFNFCIPSCGCIILFLAFGVDEYTGPRLGPSILLFALYGLSILPLMYVDRIHITHV